MAAGTYLGMHVHHEDRMWLVVQFCPPEGAGEEGEGTYVLAETAGANLILMSTPYLRYRLGLGPYPDALGLRDWSWLPEDEDGDDDGA